MTTIDFDAIRTAATKRAARSIRIGNLIRTYDGDRERWSRVFAILDGQNPETKQKVRELRAKDLTDTSTGCAIRVFPDTLVMSVPTPLARRLAPEAVANV
jgi:hypothetical protein